MGPGARAQDPREGGETLKPIDARPWLWPAAAAAFFGALWLTGVTVFWGDLTYIHHPWRTLAAQELTRGRLALWNPYAYLGMPLAAQMQSAVWYPGTIPFYVLPFEGALALFHAAHYGLAALLTFLWLRRGGLSGPAALGGAALYAASGFLASRVPFLNILSTLALAPALLLFSGSAWLIGLVSALAFLSGYPQILAGSAAAAFAVSWAVERKPPRAPAWAAGAGLAVGLAGLLFLPAAELAAGSRRGAGIPLSEMLTFSFTPRDLGGLVAPWLGLAGFDGAVNWWKTCWLGAAGTLAALAGLYRMRGRRRALLALYALLVGALVLGGSNPLSSALWEHAPGLRFVRYPGNTAYLWLPAAAVAAAAGLQGARWAGPWAALILVELGVYAALSQPVVRRPFFADPGPLVGALPGPLGSHRYLLSPLALESHTGRGEDLQAASLDLKHRLYGLTNMPYRLSAVANFGEPLVPQPSYEVMDFLYTRSGLSDAAQYMPWVDARVLLASERRPEGPLRYLGPRLWHGYVSPARFGRALWFPEREGAAIPAGLTAASELPGLDGSRPVETRADGDRVRVSGDTPSGWVYLSEPRLPGWSAWLDGRRVETQPAWRAFQKLRVPEGRWRLTLRYDPASWRLGLLVTLLVTTASLAYWYNRLRAFSGLPR